MTHGSVSIAILGDNGDGRNMLEAFWEEDFWLCYVEFAILLLYRILPRDGATSELRHWGDTQLWLDTLGVVRPCLSVGGKRVAFWGGVALYIGGFLP